MAFYPYIILDGKKYAATAKSWMPEVKKPSTVRLLADDTVDAAYGPGPLNMVTGEIIARVNETRPGWGSSSDIETSLEKKTGLAYIDHYGAASTVHCDGYKRRSSSPMWNAPSNKMYYLVSFLYVEGK